MDNKRTCLHLGCGKKTINGYINVDIQNFDNIDLCADIKNLPFGPNTIDEIYSCAAIEHFGRREWKEVVAHWRSLLKKDGILRLSTADFSAACHEYIENKDISKLFGLIVGGQKDQTDYHGMIFDFAFLKTELEKIGFVDIQRYDWKTFKAFKIANYDDYSRSYLPHMDFENGRLMMLNITCRKK
jgi:predicted SAM-dependent methyltransferase